MKLSSVARTYLYTGFWLCKIILEWNGLFQAGCTGNMCGRVRQTVPVWQPWCPHTSAGYCSYATAPSNRHAACAVWAAAGWSLETHGALSRLDWAVCCGDRVCVSASIAMMTLQACTAHKRPFVDRLPSFRPYILAWLRRIPLFLLSSISSAGRDVEPFVHVRMQAGPQFALQAAADV